MPRSPFYMASELFRDEKKNGPGVDVYAFRILAYEIVTEKVPFFELCRISQFIFAKRVTSGYRPKFTPNVPKKMQERLTLARIIAPALCNQFKQYRRYYMNHCLALCLVYNHRFRRMYLQIPLFCQFFAINFLSIFSKIVRAFKYIFI